jgi:hypothetical protein
VVHRLATLALGGAMGMSLGCSIVLDLQGYTVKGDAGPDGGRELPLGPSVANFDSYLFQRGTAVTYSVAADRGVLANDAEDARAVAGVLRNPLGGQLALAADGSFRYSPPGAVGAFWGDDYFEYELMGNPPARARVRLTLQPPALSLGELSASAGSGFGVGGAAPQDAVGRDLQSFAPAGDVNGDGLEDFVIGVPGPPGSDGFSRVGRGAYVLFGKRDAANVSLADLGGENARGFPILGDDDEQTLDSFGVVVGGAGDVNGDGLDDVIVGSYTFASVSQGVAYVIFGKTDSRAVSSDEVRAGNGGGFAIHASTPGYGWVGLDVDGAGDVNGDGLDDVVVGVPIFDASNGGSAGGAHVVFGKVGPAPVRLENITAGGTEGFTILGNQANEFLGVTVAGLGDVNGDGLSDVVVSSPVSPDGRNRGRNIVVLGATGSSTVHVGELEASSGRGFVISGANDLDNAARVAAGGDVNGDGLDDVLIGAPSASLGAPVASEPPDAGSVDARDAGDAGDARAAEPAPPIAEPPAPGDRPLRGIVYVVFGRRQPQHVSLRELENGSSNGFAIAGSQNLLSVGTSVSSGDFNGDGLSDVVATTPANASFGRAFVVFGKGDTELVSLSLAGAGSSAALPIVGRREEEACSVVVSGSDANGDGLDDLLISARLYPALPQLAGGAYVAFGWNVTGELEGRDRALIGGSEDDSFELPATPLVIARGGHGTDTLRVARANAVLDLTEPGRYESIEVIDLRGNGPQTVRLDDAALRRIPQNHSGLAFTLARKLSVLGDAEDWLEFDLEGFDVRGGSAGRVVYGREGLYYGLEISQGLTLVKP